MAWIIALLFILGIGKLICNGVDARQEAEIHRRVVQQDETREILANIYILAWHHYQKLEPQVMQACAEEGLDTAPPGSSEFFNFSEATFGVPIDMEAIKMALLELREQNLPVLASVDYTEKRQFPGLFKTIQPNEPYDAEAQTQWCYHHIPELGFFYNWEFASHSNTPYAQAKIPGKTDKRTYLFRSTRYISLLRGGVPENYEKKLNATTRTYNHNAGEAAALKLDWKLGVLTYLYFDELRERYPHVGIVEKVFYFQYKSEETNRIRQDGPYNFYVCSVYFAQKQASFDGWYDSEKLNPFDVRRIGETTKHLKEFPDLELREEFLDWIIKK